MDLGFELAWRTKPSDGSGHFLARLSSMLGERGLSCGGSQDGLWVNSLTREVGGRVTEEDRLAVATWLREQPEVEHFDATPIFDADDGIYWAREVD